VNPPAAPLGPSACVRRAGGDCATVECLRLTRACAILQPARSQPASHMEGRIAGCRADASYSCSPAALFQRARYIQLLWKNRPPCRLLIPILSHVTLLQSDLGITFLLLRGPQLRCRCSRDQRPNGNGVTTMPNRNVGGLAASSVRARSVA